jgi:RimJ/RimL family protein N-acetyltransferase
MIYGQRIRFRKPERDDLPVFVRWFNAPEVRQGLSMYHPMSMAEEERWYEGMMQRPEEERPFTIEVRSQNIDGTDSWMPIGNCSLFSFEWRNRNAELGIVIGEKAFWNQGYGSEAVQLLLRHSFNTLNLNRVWLRVYETNPRAIRFYEKIGFVNEGRKRQSEFQDGRFIDTLLMSVLRDEWKDNA